MADNNQHNQYYQNAPQQQHPNHAFHQQAMYAQQYQGYPTQMNYGNQYGQENQYYGQGEGDEYEQDDFDNLAEIDRALNNSVSANDLGGMTEEEALQAEFEKDIESRRKQTTSFLPSGAMPTGANGALSAHAAEFWFPECRNCDCCKGFKHGCSCCKNGVTSCTAANCEDNEFKQQVTSELASRPTAPAQTASTSTYTVEAPHSPHPAPRAAAPPAEVCKFESAPGGCRFGSSCRFKHSSPATGAPFAGVSAGAGGKPQCMYFARGNCQFGDSCRFGHY